MKISVVIWGRSRPGPPPNNPHDDVSRWLQQYSTVGTVGTVGTVPGTGAGRLTPIRPSLGIFFDASRSRHVAPFLGRSEKTQASQQRSGMSRPLPSCFICFHLAAANSNSPPIIPHSSHKNKTGTTFAAAYTRLKRNYAPLLVGNFD